MLQATLGFSKAQFAMFDWRPELGSTLDLVSLDGNVSKNRRFKAPAFMAVHYINSEAVYAFAWLRAARTFICAPFVCYACVAAAEPA